MISPRQSRAARELLDWSQADLVDKSGVGLSTISTFEHDKPEKKFVPRAESINKLQRTFEKYEIIFLDDDGVKRRKKEFRFINDINCCDTLFEDIFLEIKETGCEVIVAINSMEILTRFSADPRRTNLDRLKELHKATDIKCIVPDNLPVSFAAGPLEIRIVPQVGMWPTSYIIYGNKLAYVFMDNGEFRAGVYRITNLSDGCEKFFAFGWNTGKPVKDDSSKMTSRAERSSSFAVPA